jgi:hypothetical protein
MSETILLETRETKRSYGPLWLVLGVLMLGLPFLGRQRIRLTNERITVVSGFWTKVRDDIEIFRIRDVVVKQSLYHRMLGIGDVVVKVDGRPQRGIARAARRARPGRRQRADPQPVEPGGAPGGACDHAGLRPAPCARRKARSMVRTHD